MLPVIWNGHVYSTAMLSIYYGQVTALVEFVEINTPRECMALAFFPPSLSYLSLVCVDVT